MCIHYLFYIFFHLANEPCLFMTNWKVYLSAGFFSQLTITKIWAGKRFLTRRAREDRIVFTEWGRMYTQDQPVITSRVQTWIRSVSSWMNTMLTPCSGEKDGNNHEEGGVSWQGVFETDCWQQDVFFFTFSHLCMLSRSHILLQPVVVISTINHEANVLMNKGSYWQGHVFLSPF